ncbi:DUF2062 domain-containing protein [Xanthocytophaga agilis]|uniref:DUF2062 domain-containing protein n=1 Tax=Xanthocytophaga agilis TaxID=3048010 RepID=A0AAE3UDB8_9BACT|nr:DUF2062 domain-containing protein [Xanthocytophaga agilis]MDJ1500176.1 DUF2062 domain-containing protein [Xanthocytophaga agilis]
MHSTSENISVKFDQHQCCVIIPTYNNEKTLAGVVSGVLAYTSHIIVVDDGSTDSTASILSSFSQIQVVRHAINQGKGKALRTGFAAAIAAGYKYAITIDSDGQHMPADLGIFLEKLETHPHSIIIGARNMDQPGIPGKSSFGNKFSNFWFYVETGLQLPDTQSGYRLYPIQDLQKIRFFTRKFEFEIEVMVRAVWNGISVVPAPVSVYYPPAGERVSHFRPFKDFSRISVLNTVLVTIALLWYHPYSFIKNFSLSGLKKKIIEATLSSHESAHTKALSVGFGLFMGIIPAWGYQMLLAVILARLFRLNKILVLLASNISIPPMIPVILYLSNLAGALVLGNSTRLIFSTNITLAEVSRYLYQYLLGSVLIAVLAGALGYILSVGIFKRINKQTFA